eukprot:UN01962
MLGELTNSFGYRSNGIIYLNGENIFHCDSYTRNDLVTIMGSNNQIQFSMNNKLQGKKITLSYIQEDGEKDKNVENDKSNLTFYPCVCSKSGCIIGIKPPKKRHLGVWPLINVKKQQWFDDLLIFSSLERHFTNTDKKSKIRSQKVVAE